MDERPPLILSSPLVTVTLTFPIFLHDSCATWMMRYLCFITFMDNETAVSKSMVMYLACHESSLIGSCLSRKFYHRFKVFPGHACTSSQ